MIQLVTDLSFQLPTAVIKVKIRVTTFIDSVKMVQITDEIRAIARHTASAFAAERPPVFQYWDDSREQDIHIMKAQDIPGPGITAYATVGLSEHPLYFEGNEFNTRVELVGACWSSTSDFGNVLATAAFCVINSNWFCAPGRIFPDIISMHGLSKTMSDVFFTYPFLWEKQLHSTQIGKNTVAWLLVVPISRAETEYAQKYGPKKLQDLFVAEDINIYDINRASIV